MKQGTKRIGYGLVLTALAVAALVGPAAAESEPVAGCPSGWELRLVSSINFGPGELNPSVDGNGDGWTCLKPTPIPPWPNMAIVVDNRVK